MKLRIFSVLGTLFLCASASAVVIVEDDFSEYLDGDISQQGNWGGHGGDNANANVWQVSDADDTVGLNGGANSAWLGAINFSTAPGPATTPNGTYKVTIDFSIQAGTASNHSIFALGLSDDTTMSPFPNLSTDLNAQLKYNQWPNPNTNPPDQTTYKFVPSADLANTPDENTYSALVPENDLGINISQFGGNPVDSGSDNLRWSFSATHISGNIFEMETVLENVDTGLIVSSTDELIGAWTVDTSLLQDPNNPDNDFPEWGDATELMAGFRAQSMAGTDSISISNFKFEFDAPGGTGPNGDFNNDGAYDCSDVDALVGEIVAGSNDADFDMNQDGFVDAADMNDATNGWLAVAGAENTPTGGAHLPGDANLDGFVDVGDFNVWNSSKFTETAAWCSGDFNYDGFVDVGDFNLWNSNKFSSSDVAAVPEPTSGVLLMLGALFVVKARRRLAHVPH